MKVTITTKHCEGAKYQSNDDCPLARALKEVLPDSEIEVYGGWVRVDNKRYDFNHHLNSNGWEVFKMGQLRDGEIKSYDLEIIGL